jgi:hypothetical protein
MKEKLLVELEEYLTSEIATQDEQKAIIKESLSGFWIQQENYERAVQNKLTQPEIDNIYPQKEKLMSRLRKLISEKWD